MKGIHVLEKTVFWLNMKIKTPIFGQILNVENWMFFFYDSDTFVLYACLTATGRKYRSINESVWFFYLSSHKKKNLKKKLNGQSFLLTVSVESELITCLGAAGDEFSPRYWKLRLSTKPHFSFRPSNPLIRYHNHTIPKLLFNTSMTYFHTSNVVKPCVHIVCLWEQERYHCGCRNELWT